MRAGNRVLGGRNGMCVKDSKVDGRGWEWGLLGSGPAGLEAAVKKLESFGTQLCHFLAE